MQEAQMRKPSFGSLTAGMIVRGTVPPQVLYGGARPDAPPPPAKPPAPIEVKPVAPPHPIVVAEKPQPTARCTRKSLTLRLDPAQHMRLRVVGAYQRRSAQDIMVEALTAYLDRQPGCTCMPER